MKELGWTRKTHKKQAKRKPSPQSRWKSKAYTHTDVPSESPAPCLSWWITGPVLKLRHGPQWCLKSIPQLKGRVYSAAPSDALHLQWLGWTQAQPLRLDLLRRRYPSLIPHLLSKTLAPSLQNIPLCFPQSAEYFSLSRPSQTHTEQTARSSVYLQFGFSECWHAAGWEG